MSSGDTSSDAVVFVTGERAAIASVIGMSCSVLELVEETVGRLMTVGLDHREKRQGYEQRPDHVISVNAPPMAHRLR
jgi:hypothetical protein